MEPTSDKRFDPNFIAQMLLELANEQSLDKLLQHLVDRALERPHIACCQVWLIKKGDLCAICPRRPDCPDQSRCLHLVAAKATSICEPEKGFGRLDPQTTREPLGVPPIGSVVASGRNRAVPDLNKRAACWFDPVWMREEDIQGYAINPITYKGEVLGAMVTATREPFQDELQPWGVVFANQIGAAIANARAFEEITVAGKRLHQANQKLERELAERKEAEQEIALLSFALDKGREAACLIDDSARFHYVNEEACRLLGYTRAELLSLRVADIDPSFPTERWPDHWRELKSRRSLTLESRHRTRDGNLIPVEISANYFEYAGRAYNLALVRDISERKRGEDALKRSEAYLAEGQRLSHTGSWAWSPATLKSLYWSEEMFRIFGLNPQDGLVSAETLWQRIHPEDLDQARDLLLKVASCSMEYEHEHRILLPDGTIKHIHSIGHPVLDENGKLVEYVGTAIDVTERKRAEDELRKHREHLEDLVKQRTEQLAEAKARAEAANREKSRFLANMSHELRTPLNAVLGFSRLLKRGPDVTASQQEALDIIVRSGEHLLNLINNVLDMAKIESGRVVLEESEVDLHRLLHEIQSLMGVGAAEKGLAFSLNFAPDLPRFVGVDAGKLRQVLLNLLGNAIKFTDSGRVTLRANPVRNAPSAEPGAGCAGERAQVRFEVEDSGPGISQGDCERIFDPFVQLDGQAPAQAGTGLGLAICKQYVDLMGGHIGIQSQPGTGSMFYFDIPVSVLPSVSEPQEQQHRLILGLAEGQRRFRLLIVEDQPENRLLLRRLLDPLGFELREAVNGQEAVALFEQWRPDLIWMDVRMPVMDGLEAVRRIRRSEAGARTKIVALTAHALEEEKRTILAAGCDDLVRKPFRELEIFEVLSRHLRLKFLYADAPRSKSAPEAPGPASSTRQVEDLPADLLRDLRKSVIELDTARTQALLKNVADHNAALGQALSTVAAQLDYKRLLKLLETGHSQTGQHS